MNSILSSYCFTAPRKKSTLAISEDKSSARKYFPDSLKNFISDSTIVSFSPGRINLIGEFTDYNMGYVLPAAVDKGVYVAVTPRHDQQIRLHSLDFNDTFQSNTTDLTPAAAGAWPNYLLGVCAEFKHAGIPLRGFDAAITGNIPIGSGLSSSAAVECATAMAVNHMMQTHFGKLELVKMSLRAENNYVGVQCGIMDQFASMFGKADHAIKLDCRSLDFEYLPLNMDDLCIVLLNSNVKHSHGSSDYNERRAQCEAGVAIIRQQEPQVSFLRDATLEMIDHWLSTGDATIYKRCRFIVEENERVVGAAEDLRKNDLVSFGRKMFASHDGLQHLFEASCAELDFLVNCVREHPGVLGARMMGGGFGGCTINLVKAGAVESLIAEVSAQYNTSMKKQLTPHIAGIEAGTTLLQTPPAGN